MHRMGKLGRLGVLPLVAGAALLLAVGENKLVGADRATVPSPAPSAVQQKNVRAAAAKMPLRFEQNIGQVTGQEARNVKFVSRGSAYSLFLTRKEAVLEMRQRSNDATQTNASVVLRMSLSGANRSPGVVGLDELPGRSNYLIGNDSSKWHTGVTNFSRVAETGVYPGIDLVYHGNEGQLEYDFDVAPHADPRNIRIALAGAKGLQVDANGDLVVKVADGDIHFRQPVAYQNVNGRKIEVPVHYALHGGNQATFALASYDRRQPLVIDPILSYSTYLGGTNIDSGNGIAVAPDGTAFIAGGTFSTDFPTAGAHPLQPNHNGADDFPKDAFVSKMSADGTTLLYSTYLGGSDNDVANGITVDAAGEAFVVGTTSSPDFPTVGGINRLCGGDGHCGGTWNPQGFIVTNAFVSKLNTAGSGLVYSTFLGYYENVAGYAIAVDSALNTYVTGETGPNIAETVPLTSPEVPPPPFPITGTAFEPTYNNQPEDTFGICTTVCGGTNAFITKIDAAGAGILYSSYLGGDDTTYGYGVAVDTHADAYITGLTYSATGFPITAGNALQINPSGAGDAFLTKVNTAGSGSPLYSTFLGGAGIDQGNAIAVDANGIAYITGGTTSVSSGLGFTPPAGGFQTNCTLDTLNVCEGDAFIAKINPALTGSASLLYFSWLGGSLYDSGSGIALDPTGKIYITGQTVSPDYPIQGAVFQSKYGGGNADAFVTELNSANPSATALVYSSYLGGSNTDVATGIAVDISGDAFVTGQSCSLDFPLANPEQSAAGGNCDAFVSKIIQSGGVSLSPAGLVFASENVGQQSPSQTITLTNGANVALAIASIAISGSDAADYAILTNTCGSSVPANSTCAISVSFTPTSITPPTRTAKVTFTDTETGGSQETQVVDLTGSAGAAPIVSLSSQSLTFGTQSVGITSAAQVLTITNTGTAALTISSVVASGNYAVTTNNCTTALQATAPPSNCTVSVTFTPNVGGQSIGSLTITDNAPDSPQIVLLTGTGALQASVSLSPTSLTFGGQVVGSTSAPQVITVTNTGTAPLTFGAITTTSGFGQTNTCGAPVLPKAICTISVTFTPTGLGSNTGSLTINDSAPDSPQLVPLSGGGSDFAVALSTGSTTVVAGDPATLTISVSSVAGYNSPVALACSGAPALATCSASPSTVTPSSAGAATATLQITTTRRTSVPPGGLPRFPGSGLATRPWVWFALALMMLSFGISAAKKNRREWNWAILLLTALWLASFAACGSGGAGYTNPTGTPSGTYTLTVTGSSAGLSHSTTFTLVVK